MKKKTNVAILIPNYNGKHLLDDCLKSIYASECESTDLLVYIADNSSTDGSVTYIKESWPNVRIVELNKNYGYAGGNNRGFEAILKDDGDVEYLYLLNSDTIVYKKFLDPLVEYMASHDDCGSAQSKLLLHPETDKINSNGNRIHFLGFGYATSLGEINNPEINQIRKINYASGAGAMLRVSMIKQIGLFADFMFMYLEDLDLGWRITLSGRTNVIVPDSVIYHKFEFSRGMTLYYYFERNRLWILLTNYKLATLILIFPAWVFMELGQIVFAAFNGHIKDKFKSYLYFMSIRNLDYLLKQRKARSKLRRISDRKLIKTFTGKIEYQPLDNVLVKYVANPVLSMYHFVLSYIIFW